MSNATIRINDVWIELVKCDHCGAVPDEAEAKAGIQAYIARMGESLCVACGQVVQPEGYTIEHLPADGQSASWHALPQPGTWCHVGVALGRPTLTRGYKLHIACAKKVLPHLDLEALMNPPRPWPSIEKLRGAGS